MKKFYFGHALAIFACVLTPIVVAIVSSAGTYGGKCVGQTAEGFNCGYAQFLVRHMFPFDIISWVICALLTGSLAWHITVNYLGRVMRSDSSIRWSAAVVATLFLFFGFATAAIVHSTALGSVVTWLGL